MPANPYQRTLVSGVPVWKDASGSLFAYEPNGAVGPKLGTLADGFAEDWAARLQAGLEAYRGQLRARPRGSGSSSASR
jgi:hypothetical protein